MALCSSATAIILSAPGSDSLPCRGSSPSSMKTSRSLAGPHSPASQRMSSAQAAVASLGTALRNALRAERMRRKATRTWCTPSMSSQERAACSHWPIWLKLCRRIVAKASLTLCSAWMGATFLGFFNMYGTLQVNDLVASQMVAEKCCQSAVEEQHGAQREGVAGGVNSHDRQQAAESLESQRKHQPAPENCQESRKRVEVESTEGARADRRRW